MSFTNTRDLIGDQATLDGLVAHTLSEFQDNGVDKLRPSAFRSNSGIMYVELPILSLAPGNAFGSCTSLVSAVLPVLGRADSYMFNGCTALKDISMPAVTTIEASAFSGCTSLEIVDFPNVTIIYNNAFNSCTKLTSVSFPAVYSVYSSAFKNAPIAKLALPSAMRLNRDITYGNGAAEVELGLNPEITASVFAGDRNLISLILRSSSQLTLANVNALQTTPIAKGYGWIYVPSTLVSTYQEGTNWATYQSRIVSLDDYPLDVGTITDTWDEILTAEEDGTYTSKYSVGDTKVITVGGELILMQIVAMDRDELTSGGNTKITWICLGVQYTHSMNGHNTNADGWAATTMRSWLHSDILRNMDETLQAGIKTVNKTYYDYTSNSTKISEDQIWIPSVREVFGGSEYESSGCDYTDFFSTSDAKRKWTGLCGLGENIAWWTRSAYQGNWRFRYVQAGGSQNGGNAGDSMGVVFGFCT